jgi:hypothetical protein
MKHATKQTRMPRRDDRGLVGTTRDRDELLQAVRWAAGTLEEAVEIGALARMKITGNWLYTASTSLDAAMGEVEPVALRQLRTWLIGAAPYLRHPIARACKRPRVTPRAADLMVRQLVREQRIGYFGVLTGEYEPYLALYAPEDADEVDAQIAAMAECLEQHGRVRSRDLPAPNRDRDGNGWRSLVLRHGEFLGLGTLREGVLISWEALGAD